MQTTLKGSSHGHQETERINSIFIDFFCLYNFVWALIVLLIFYSYIMMPSIRFKWMCVVLFILFCSCCYCFPVCLLSKEKDWRYLELGGEKRILQLGDQIILENIKTKNGIWHDTIHLIPGTCKAETGDFQCVQEQPDPQRVPGLPRN